jgi:hypothetical protein
VQKANCGDSKNRDLLRLGAALDPHKQSHFGMVNRGALAYHISAVPWIHEHLTVKSRANFRDWSIKYHSRSRTFTVNERNSNNKSLKEKIEETSKNPQVFQIV